MAAPPRDRGAILAGHLGGAGGSGASAAPLSQLAPAPTAAPVIDPSAPADPADLQYAVALPEHLDAPGPWPVRR